MGRLMGGEITRGKHGKLGLKRHNNRAKRVDEAKNLETVERWGLGENCQKFGVLWWPPREAPDRGVTW